MTNHDAVFFRGQRYDTESLQTLSTKELLDIYNKLGSKPVSRFESHGKGVIRVWNALQAYSADVLIQDAIDNPDTTPNSNLERGADPKTDVPALDDDCDATAAIAKLKEKSGALGRQIKAVKKAAAVAAKPVSQVERLLDVFRQHPDGIDLTALSYILGADGKRVRGLIDSARSRGARIVKVDGVKSTWRLA